MSEVLEKEAEEFSEYLIMEAVQSGRENVKSELESKIFTISRYRDKYHFLLHLTRYVDQDLEDHRKRCKSKNCQAEENYKIITFTIGELIEETAKCIENTNHDKFTIEEKLLLNTTLTDILEILRKHDAAHEVLFNEIQIVKEHLDLDKTSFNDLLRGKIQKWISSNLITPIIAEQIIKRLNDLGNDSIRFIDGKM